MVTARLISPKDYTLSNHGQRPRIMLTPVPSCLEGNTSPITRMRYSLSGFYQIGGFATGGVASGY